MIIRVCDIIQGGVRTIIFESSNRFLCIFEWDVACVYKFDPFYEICSKSETNVFPQETKHFLYKILDLFPLVTWLMKVFLLHELILV